MHLRSVITVVLLVLTAALLSPAPAGASGASGAAGAAGASRAAGAPGAAERPSPTTGVWPLRPTPAVARGFDPPASRWGRGHRGVDLSARIGQRVRAARAGRISFAGRLAGRGVVVVDHGTTRTTYEPVLAAASPGDRVAAGEVIGRLQVFGSHCFPRACLHWGLIQGRSRYLDPLTLVGGGPVRLLPLGGGPLRTAAGPRAIDAGDARAPTSAPWTPPRTAAPTARAWSRPTWRGRPSAFGAAALPSTDRPG